MLRNYRAGLAQSKHPWTKRSLWLARSTDCSEAGRFPCRGFVGCRAFSTVLRRGRVAKRLQWLIASRMSISTKRSVGCIQQAPEQTARFSGACRQTSSVVDRVSHEYINKTECRVHSTSARTNGPFFGGVSPNVFSG